MSHQGRAQVRRLAVMAVAAVLLATVVAASFGGGPPSSDPRASFSFAVDNDTVLVSHFGGDTIEGANLAVESGERGRLGTFDGSDGTACETNVSRVRPGTVCRVPDGAHERLLVVWEGPTNRSLILARRSPDPTPTVTPTTRPPTATSTASSEPTPTETPTPTPVPTPTPTATPEPNSVPTPTPTPANTTGRLTGP